MQKGWRLAWLLLALPFGACGRTSVDVDGPFTSVDASVDARRDGPTVDASVPDHGTVECPDGQHLCDGECVEEGLTSCGPSCSPCPSPPVFGAVACVEGACTTSCDEGWIVCGNACCRRQVTGGFLHTCAIDAAGIATCWGDNSGGQLGDGTTTNRLTPTLVDAPFERALAIAAGGTHTCAISTEGAIYCWGQNWLGQLGDGTSTSHVVPKPVKGITSGATAIAAGFHTTCAIADGKVWCWGSLDGALTVMNVPTEIEGIASGEAKAIAVGGQHACVLTKSGAVKCWGHGGYLGNGSTTSSSVAVDVDLGSPAVALAAGGGHTCTIQENGEVMCWGANSTGQLGVPRSTAFATSPVLASGLSDPASAITVGAAHTCALTTEGVVQCWGEASVQQFPYTSGLWTHNATEVSGFPDRVRSLAAGYYHTCALLDTGMACWGMNTSGQLGDGSLISTYHPQPVSGP